MPAGVSVRDVVGYGRHPYRGRWRADDPDGPRAIAWAMDVTGVTAMADRAVDELSGGELQRVWLATCLAQDTGVLLLDEPTTFLDLRYQVEILDLIRDLADEHGVAVGVVLHDLDQAAAVADQVVLLARRRVVRAAGAPRDVLTEPALTRDLRHPGRGARRPGDRPPHHPTRRPAPPPDAYRKRIRMKRFPLLAVAAVAVLAVGACGTTEEAAAPAPAAVSDAATGPVTVTDGRGKEITLPKPATRVVSLEWGETEMLVSLGVMPVGSADIKGYATWDTAAKLDAVGQGRRHPRRAQRRLDRRAAARPGRDGGRARRADRRAAREVRAGAGHHRQRREAQPRPAARRRHDDRHRGRQEGRGREAALRLRRPDRRRRRPKLAAAGAAGKPFAMADGWKEGSTVSIRMFGKGALVSDLGTAIGLENAWTTAGDQEWGLGQTDVEGLKALDGKDVRFFYNASDGGDVFADGLTGNAIWDALDFVKAGKVHKLPDGIWTFGGPKSCIQ